MKGIMISSQDRNQDIIDYPLQESYFIPVEKELYIQYDDIVKEGQLLTANMSTNVLYHSPVHGKVVDILTYQYRQYIEIKRDGHLAPKKYSLTPPKGVPSDILIKRIKDAGVSQNLHIDLAQSIKNTSCVVLNGLDSEPFITSAYSLLMDKTQEIIQAIIQLKYILDSDNIVIAIHKNSVLKKHIESFIFDNNIKLIEVPKRYPLHNDKLIVDYLSRKEPLNFNQQKSAFVVNTHIAFAVYEALFYQKPLTEKIISVEGAYSLNHGNFRVKIGTPISAFMRPFSVESSYVMFAGGPITGTTLEKEKSLTKQMDAVMIFEGKPKSPETPCIFCNACVLSCPINLEPIKLVDFIQNREFNKADEYHIEECIQCNVCTYICPSFIPLGGIIKQYLNQGEG